MRQIIGEPFGEVGREACSNSPRILISPYTNTTNLYIEIQKRLLKDIGYDVQPLSAKSLFSGSLAHIFSTRTVLVFHWLELRPFRRREGRVVLSLKGCLIFAFYCSVICLGRAKVVYFVHDHAVHDTVGFRRRLSVRLIALMRRLADFRVVHAPCFEARYDARYLPHPLYWDAPSRPPGARPTERRAPAFSMLGTIRPYKEIAAVLDVWPRGYRLEIAGNGSAAYVKTLHDVVNSRSLQDVVKIDSKFLSDQEFEQRICATDVLILPHAADSMLVSGAFFEAIGRVPVIISRSTPFMVWVLKKFKNVLLFDRIDQLPEIVLTVANAWPSISEGIEDCSATDEFGWRTCRQRYKQFFDNVVQDTGARDGSRVQ